MANLAIPQSIRDLTQRFEREKHIYRSASYKETEVREDFINPFFDALGWDVNNTKGIEHVQREVVKEYSLRPAETLNEDEDIVRHAMKADRRPDYAFLLGGDLKFFVEAKKPARNIETDRYHAFQTRSYGWSSNLPVSVLTDFEELAVYDCHVQPASDDPPATARILYLTYNHYADRWDDIASLLSREAVLGGSLDKFVSERGAKRGTVTVDAAFLKEISTWREWLARDIAARNPSLPTRDLNYAVQMTIDRIIFLRIAEDRGTEPFSRLAGVAKNEGVYPRLCNLFHDADDRYNSGLFHFRAEPRRDAPDGFTLSLQVGDKPLRDIIERLYYPHSPYKFSVMPVEILGQVYEQFLGKVVRINLDRTVEVEEKPEVRKAGGVYYTPRYIVDYIVRYTVGKLVEGKTPDEVAKLRVLDPACGSGSFLIGAYSYLLDWHLDWYVRDGKRSKTRMEKHTKGKDATLRQVGPKDKDYRLTLGERKRILLGNIYGVDIDTQAVEVTKLSLLLKVMEGEEGTVQARAFEGRILPDLDGNIKCGNSLIGPEIEQQMSFAREEAYRINAFSWEDNFPQVMKVGGFDAVIGNPPYIRIQTMKEWAPVEVEHYKQLYTAASKGNYDIYVVFVERGLSLLNKNGRLGFILPHKFFNAQYGEPLRGLLAKGKYLSYVVHFGDQQVFSEATTYTCLIFLDKAGSDAGLFSSAS